MKRIAWLTLLPVTMFLSACSSMGSSSEWYDYNNQVVNGILEPGQAYPTDYQQPRQYYVTEQDQSKYQSINDRVQQRMQSLQSQQYTSKPSTSSYAPSASDQSIVQTTPSIVPAPPVAPSTQLPTPPTPSTNTNNITP